MKKRRSTVGVRELRTHFSEYLRRVVAGETVTIGNRRHVPIAHLVPAATSDEMRHMGALAERGAITPGHGKPGSTPRVRGRGARTVAEIVRTERG